MFVWLRMRVLFMAGYTDPDAIGDAAPAAADNFLQKRFAPGLLVRSVRAVLDRPASV